MCIHERARAHTHTERRTRAQACIDKKERERETRTMGERNGRARQDAMYYLLTSLRKSHGRETEMKRADTELMVPCHCSCSRCSSTHTTKRTYTRARAHTHTLLRVIVYFRCIAIVFMFQQRSAAFICVQSRYDNRLCETTTTTTSTTTTTKTTATTAARIFFSFFYLRLSLLLPVICRQLSYLLFSCTGFARRVRFSSPSFSSSLSLIWLSRSSCQREYCLYCSW